MSAESNPIRRQKEDIPDSTWGPENAQVLEAFGSTRGLVMRAFERMINATLRPYFGKGKRALEIGAGTGFMRQAFTSEEGEWIQLEPQRAFIEQSKMTSPSSDQFIEGTVYDIPLEDESLDLVTGWASFDVFHDIDAAVEEVARVLKADGTFVHFLDVGANHALIRALLTKHELTHRFREGGPFNPSALSVPRTLDPEKATIRKQLVFKNFGTSDEVDVTLSFQKLLKEALKRHGFKIISSGREVGAHVGHRTAAQEQFPDAGSFYHGDGTAAVRSGLPYYVAEDVEAVVIVARKENK